MTVNKPHVLASKSFKRNFKKRFRRLADIDLQWKLVHLIWKNVKYQIPLKKIDYIRYFQSYVLVHNFGIFKCLKCSGHSPHFKNINFMQFRMKLAVGMNFQNLFWMTLAGALSAPHVIYSVRRSRWFIMPMSYMLMKDAGRLRAHWQVYNNRNIAGETKESNITTTSSCMLLIF